jgi:sterol 3beta-glucosyltransferase
MHYGIVAIGSRGDVQPYTALALGLMNRGHEATVMAHENFKDFVEGFGVAFLPLKGDVEGMLQSQEGMRVIKAGDIVAFSRYLQKITRKTGESIVSDIFDGCRKADVLIASLLALPWVEGMAEKLGKKWAVVQLNLPSIATKAFPMVAMDFFHFPAYNLLTYRLFEFIYYKTNKKPVDDFRQSLGLPAMKMSVMQKMANEKILNLHCFSPALLARPDDWEIYNDITGFLFLPGTDHKNIPEDLIRWLGNGDKPFYIGFGSIPIPDPTKFESILKKLLDTTTYRFIFCQGWSLPDHLPDHPRLFKVKTISHEWLLPRCQAAIIHGGVGTTAAVLRAKIPVIIVSIIADQPWWGKIIERKNLGVHVPFKKLTTQKLLSAIEKIKTATIKHNAFEMGEQINRQDGLKKTIDELERYFDGKSRNLP